jgi:hypothetical protein
MANLSNRVDEKTNTINDRIKRGLKKTELEYPEE